MSFEVAPAKEYPGDGYDLVAMFDCLHDMGDPVGAAAHVLQTLRADGTWLIVEPYAGDRLGDNLNPVGRVFYGGLALGAQAGEARLREVVTGGGFFRRATDRQGQHWGVRGSRILVPCDAGPVVAGEHERRLRQPPEPRQRGPEADRVVLSDIAERGRGLRERGE